MATKSKSILTALALCIALISFNTKLAAEDSDSTQILATTKAYIDITSTAGNYKLEIFQQTKQWALVSVIPIPEGSYEGAGVVLEKVGNKWVVRDMGTDLSEYESRFN